MYFPKGFDTELSIELAELIIQAYAQFEAFENEQRWKLPDKYSLKAEFSYLWTPGRTIEKGIRNFDLTLRRLSRSTRAQDYQDTNWLCRTTEGYSISYLAWNTNRQGMDSQLQHKPELLPGCKPRESS